MDTVRSRGIIPVYYTAVKIKWSSTAECSEDDLKFQIYVTKKLKPTGNTVWFFTRIGCDFVAQVSNWADIPTKEADDLGLDLANMPKITLKSAFQASPQNEVDNFVKTTKNNSESSTPQKIEQISTKTTKTNEYYKWNAWSSWSDCICDSDPNKGATTRVRQCVSSWTSNPVDTFRCMGVFREVGPCNCVKPEWSAWGKWTTCSKPCGGGRKKRLRLCENSLDKSECAGKDNQIALCNVKKCPEEKKFTVLQRIQPSLQRSFATTERNLLSTEKPQPSIKNRSAIVKGSQNILSGFRYFGLGSIKILAKFFGIFSKTALINDVQDQGEDSEHSTEFVKVKPAETIPPPPNSNPSQINKSCQDKYSFCQHWSEKGYCYTKFQKWMDINCSLSCQGCQQDKDQEHSNNVRPLECKDRYPISCPKWAFQGRCNHPDKFLKKYIENSCNKSCRVC